ncbi:hypothetical protein LAUMK4_05728 [Mycobacterium persicum]|uniref:Uncharacterized protein n=1 Tax=Mycobacterium persicum TaxID=1487726 RepID=A0ABY6RSM3_9MYCO|nr:hypothetical protein LAUMK15_05689 [Mycobacterium persicum]VBA32347.1 hypothetical protein LAUMK4_05728 [Mycobacterium persicum]
MIEAEKATYTVKHLASIPTALPDIRKGIRTKAC